MAYMRPGQEPPAKGKGSKLSPKMERFIDEFFVDLNASEAVLRAGYKTRNQHRMASELMRHPLVEEEINRRKEKMAEKKEIQADYLINKLIDIIDNTEKSNVQACLRAIELAGKSIALWKERQEVSGPDGGAIELEQKKVQDDVADFTSRLSRLAKRGGEGEVIKFPDRGAEGSS